MKYDKMDKDRLVYEHDCLIKNLKLLEKRLLQFQIKVSAKDRGLDEGTNEEKLKTATRLLSDVCENWSEDEVEEYGATMSFDELVAEIGAIRLKDIDASKTCEGCGEEHLVNKDNLCKDCQQLKDAGAFQNPPITEVTK